MLRYFKNNRPRSCVQSFTFNSTTAPSVTATIGLGDTNTLARASAGNISAGLETPIGAAPPFMAGAPGVSAPNGSAICIGGLQTNTTLLPTLQSNGGAGIDGDYEIISYGWRGPLTSATNLALSKVESSKDRGRMIWAKINAVSGAVIWGKGDFACTKGGTGVLNVTFKKPFGRTPVIVPTPIFANASGQRLPRVSAKSGAGCTISTFDRTPTANDASFIYLVVYGVDSTSESCVSKEPLWSSQRKPRIVAGRVVYTAGAPSVSVGVGDFTVADTGVGVCTITLTRPFAREFAIIGAVRTGARFSVETSTTNGVAVINTPTTAAGTLADPVSFDFIAIGSDDATDY